MTMTDRAYDPADISTRGFWALPPAAREPVFAELRRDRPLSWHPPADTDLMPDEDDPGFWALVTHADIVAVSRDSETFASGATYGGVMLENVPEDILEAAHSILTMDAPRHAAKRRVIASTFTPRRVALIEDQIRAQARTVIDDLGDTGEVDLVEAVSARLPIWTLSEMVGIPVEDRERVAAAANAMVSWNDPEFVGDGDGMQVLMDSMMELYSASFSLVEERRARPADDLMSALVQAEVDGEQLTGDEIASLFVLLSVAGSDTTRQSTTHAVLALDRCRDQRDLLLADFDARIGGAIEEFVRWSTPVLTFRRTATRDTEIRGQRIAEGEKVVMFYLSGNRDAAVFADPDRFDITRDPNPHVGFGGGGAHFCLGSNVARIQLRAIFDEILHRLPNLEVGEPEYLAGNFINGIKRLPVRY